MRARRTALLITPVFRFLSAPSGVHVQQPGNLSVEQPTTFELASTLEAITLDRPWKVHDDGRW